MSAFDSKIIGYIASETKIKVICTDVDACLIAGSKNDMGRYLIELEVDFNEQAGRRFFIVKIDI